MNYNDIEIKSGVNLHIIDRKDFKTNVACVFLTSKIERNSITSEALIPAVLRRGTNNIKDQKLISKKLEDMYGSSFNCGVEKIGDNHDGEISRN